MLETHASFFFARLATALRPLRLKIFSGTHRAASRPQETPNPRSKSQLSARFPPIGHVDRQFSNARWHRRCNRFNASTAQANHFPETALRNQINRSHTEARSQNAVERRG